MRVANVIQLNVPFANRVLWLVRLAPRQSIFPLFQYKYTDAVRFRFTLRYFIFNTKPITMAHVEFLIWGRNPKSKTEDLLISENFGIRSYSEAERVCEALEKRGCSMLRIQVIDFSKPLDFTKTINSLTAHVPTPEPDMNSLRLIVNRKLKNKQ